MVLKFSFKQSCIDSNPGLVCQIIREPLGRIGLVGKKIQEPLTLSSLTAPFQIWYQPFGRVCQNSGWQHYEHVTTSMTSAHDLITMTVGSHMISKRSLHNDSRFGWGTTTMFSMITWLPTTQVKCQYIFNLLSIEALASLTSPGLVWHNIQEQLTSN